jgi:hypothetical protein
MRLSLPALLCAGTLAFGQAPSPAKIDPDKLFQMPKKFSEMAPDPSKPAIAQKFRMDSVHPMLHLEVLRPVPNPVGPKLNDPQIDPKIIIRPPWRSESRGQDVGHRLYPDLKLLPLQRGPRMAR